jgi:hypothetical protein
MTVRIPHAFPVRQIMTLRPPIDVAAHVSAELSALIEAMVDDPDREQPPTLEDVQVALKNSPEGDRLHPQNRASVVIELDDLIAEFGNEAPAVDFVGTKASEALSRVIEAAMDDPELTDSPTLRAVREAMVNGLTARLVGNGVIEGDEDATLLGEIDGLIRRHGENEMAETFIRLE